MSPVCRHSSTAWLCATPPLCTSRFPVTRYAGLTAYDDGVETILLTLVVGTLVGVVVGALGAGGGILAVPVLVHLLGQDPHDATAMSLIIVAITSLAGIRHHARVGNVAWYDGLVFAGVSAVGTVLGSRLQVFVDGDLLMVLLGVVLSVVAVVMLVKGLRDRRRENRGSADAASSDAIPADVVSPASSARRRTNWSALIATGTLTGLLTGFFGVGGGFIVVPMLVLALGLSMRRASGTSLLVMLMTTGIALASRVGTDVHIDWLVTLLFATASAVGAAAGGPLSARARPSTLTMLFAALLGSVAAVVLVQAAMA